MIFLRVFQGIREHFPLRVTEWAMLWPAAGMGVALALQPDMFSRTPAFSRLAQWGDESTWQALILGCVVARLAALVVNGTFAGFRYAPHLRLGASLLGILFWSQYCLGVTAIALEGITAWSAPVMYSTAVILEIVNASRSAGDVRRAREARDA